MMFRHAPRSRRLAALLVLLVGGAAGGCGGPTRTAGTAGVPAEELAVLSVPQLPDEAHVRIRTIRFDDSGDAYDVGGGRDFYVLPGGRTAALTFVARTPTPPGVAGWFVPSRKLTLPPVTNVPLGTMTAGKTYELAAPSLETFEQLLDGGGLSLVREKVK